MLDDRPRRRQRPCRVLLVGGGTGGHVSPLLAIAEALREIDPDVGFLFLGGRRGKEAELVPAAGIPFHATPMPSLRDPDSRLALLRTLVGVPLAFFDALARLVRFRPDVCCTTGGVVAIPVTLAARFILVPVYLWDGNALPGRATRLLASFCSRIGVSYEQARRSLPRGRTVLAGTPIRASLLKWTRERGRETFAVPADAMLVVVSGGSQGSERINDALWSALGRILRRAGKPIVVVPADPVPAGSTVMIAYDGSPAATRSLRSFAASGLARGRPIHVAAVQDDGALAFEIAARGCELLDREFGIRGEPDNIVSPSTTTVALLERRQQLAAGLIVLGGYVPSPLARLVWGSVTHGIVERTVVPVFLHY